MPFVRITVPHISATEGAAILAKLDQAIALILPKSINFTAEQRDQYGSINEQNKLFVNKVADYYASSPALADPDTDWAEYTKCGISRDMLGQIKLKIAELKELTDEPEIAHDYNQYHDGLKDLHYSEYKAGTSATGYEAKYNDLKQFFPNG